MGLIRNAAVIAVAITLIPADPQERANLYNKAHQGVTWASTFCERNKKTCIKGTELRDAFLEKASFAASSAYDIALVHMTGEDHNQNLDAMHTQYSQQRPAIGTLTGHDRQTKWRGRH